MEFSLSMEEPQKDRIDERVRTENDSLHRDGGSLSSGWGKSIINEDSIKDEQFSEQSTKEAQILEEKKSIKQESIGSTRGSNKEVSSNKNQSNPTVKGSVKTDLSVQLDQDMETDQIFEMDQKVEVEMDQKVEVEMDQKVEVEMDQKVEVEKNETTSQKTELDSTIEMEQNVKVDSMSVDINQIISADYNIDIYGNQNVEMDENLEVNKKLEDVHDMDLNQDKETMSLNNSPAIEMDQSADIDPSVETDQKVDFQSIHSRQSDEVTENVLINDNTEDMSMDVKPEDSKTQQQLKDLIDGLNCKLEEQNDRIKMQEQELKTLKDNSNAIALLNNFILIKRKFEIDHMVPESLKAEGDIWTSPFTFTHVSGYKYCFFMASKGFSVTLHVKILEGEFDSMLKWPLKANFVIEISTLEGDKSIRGVTGEKRYKKPSEVQTAYPFYFKLRLEDIYQAYLDLPLIESLF